MTRPEWDIALICEESGLTPEAISDLLRRGDGIKLENVSGVDPHIFEDQWDRILAAAEASGAITKIPKSDKFLEKSRWSVSPEALNSLEGDVNLVLNILPDAKKRFSSDLSYHFAATIPENLGQLRGLFSEFENTVLGLRRMISKAFSEITILVPFMDAEGLSEILPPLKSALKRGVQISFLTRDLGEKGRNKAVLSELTDAAKRKGGSLRLLEAVLSDDSPISHAKVLSKDGGDEVYVGSANLTAASMERTIEIGVFLKGKQTRAIDNFLSALKSVARQRWP